MADERQTRPPRGALIVIAIGLLATVAAALLSTSDKSAGAASLEWEVEQGLPSSKPASVPGGGGTMQLVDAGLRGTGQNVSGYQLYRSAATLSISKRAPIGGGRVDCKVLVPPRHTIVAHTPNNRGSYPRPSEEEDLIKQEVPEQVVVEFTAHGTDAAIVELGDAFNEFVDERGVTVSWAPFRIGRQGWQWGLPPGRPARQLDLGFASIWRTTGTPTAQISCTLTTSAGASTVKTGGSLPAKPGPLAE
ncbi:MAG TPA: hypothetical protein VGH58_04425 [Solirubrobacterales bacterium]